MKYRVAFMDRTNAAGESSEYPPGYVAVNAPDGVILEKRFVERTAPAALHSEESLEEDDSFMSVGAELWEYDVADERRDEFVTALKNSRMVMDYEAIED